MEHVCEIFDDAEMDFGCECEIRREKKELNMSDENTYISSHDFLFYRNSSSTLHTLWLISRNFFLYSLMSKH